MPCLNVRNIANGCRAGAPTSSLEEPAKTRKEVQEEVPEDAACAGTNGFENVVLKFVEM
jgi:hypothetical protein